MLTAYLNESLRAYEQKIDDEILKYKPKHPLPYGIKLPDARKIVAVGAGIVVASAIAAELLA